MMEPMTIIFLKILQHCGLVMVRDITVLYESQILVINNIHHDLV